MVPGIFNGPPYSIALFGFWNPFLGLWNAPWAPGTLFGSLETSLIPWRPLCVPETSSDYWSPFWFPETVYMIPGTVYMVPGPVYMVPGPVYLPGTGPSSVYPSWTEQHGSSASNQLTRKDREVYKQGNNLIRP